MYESNKECLQSLFYSDIDVCIITVLFDYVKVILKFSVFTLFSLNKILYKYEEIGHHESYLYLS